MDFKDIPKNIVRKIKGKYIIPSRPAVIHIELNNTCNLRCNMCPRDHLQRKSQNMDFELYKKIIDEASGSRIKHVRLFLFGEPLLYPKLIEAIKYAKNAGINKVDFNTNANLLDQQMAKRIATSGLDAIIFSVDGFTKETYESIRIKGNYERCISNIIYFLDYLKEMNIDMDTTIQTIEFETMDSNEIENYRSFWKDKVNLVSITRLNPMQGLVKEVNYTNYSRNTCYEAFSKMVILSNGIVTTCCDDFNGELKLGNINSSTIKDIWHGSKWKIMRSDFEKHHYSNYLICQQCLYSYKMPED